MNRLALAALAALVLAVPASAQIDSTHTTSPFNGVTVNPCNGDVIQYVGTCQTTVKTKASGDRTEVRTHSACEAHGVSLVPDRTTYRFLTNNSIDTVTTAGCGTEQEVRERVRVVSWGKEQNFFMDTTFVVRLDENCQVVVEPTETDTDCRAAGE